MAPSEIAVVFTKLRITETAKLLLSTTNWFQWICSQWIQQCLENCNDNRFFPDVILKWNSTISFPVSKWKH